MSKVGILKQAFNPITLQDIDFAKKQMKKLKLDKVYFVVLKDENKPKKRDRKQMVSLALEDIDNIELMKEKDSNIECVYLNNKNSININKKVMKGDFTLLDEKVKDYILDNCFYFKTIIRNNLRDNRYKHSLSVSKLAVELARAHNYDEKKAYTAGIFHDICKELPYKKTMELMKKYFKDKLKNPGYLFHAYLGMVFARDKLLIKDEEILNSIYHHVLGTDDGTLSKIIYISDKLDPSRGYDSSYLIKLSLKNLDLGFKQTRYESNRYNKEKN